MARRERREIDYKSLYAPESLTDRRIVGNLETTAQSFQPHHVPLAAELERMRWQRSQPQHPRIPRPRKLPNRDGIDDLEKVITQKKDIKYIRNALSKQGAQKWIDDHGYHGQLFVHDEDIDGDEIPDIVVRNQAGQPYIIKGYTTTPSKYPYMHKYYTKYPTKELRKDHTFKDFIGDESLKTQYFQSGMKRIYDPNVEGPFNRLSTLGYAKMIPSPKVSITAAFKKFIIKPIMKTLKSSLKDVIPLTLDPNMQRQLETYLRLNNIIFPAARAVYGDDVMNQSNEDFQKLIKRKEVNEFAARVLGNFIANRNEHLADLVYLILLYWLNHGGMPPDTVIDETMVNRLADQVAQSRDWNPTNLYKEEEITPEILAQWQQQAPAAPPIQQPVEEEDSAFY